MSFPKFGVIALCDNVYRDHVSSKFVLAGMFSGDVLFNEFPGQVSAAIYVEVLEADDGEISLELMLDNELIGTVSGKFATQDDAPGIVVIPNFTIHAEKPATIKLRARYGDKSKIVFQRKIRAMGA